MNKMKRNKFKKDSRRNLLINVILLLFVCLCCFVLFEVVARVGNLAPLHGFPPGMVVLDDNTGYALTPNFSARVDDPEYSMDISINEKGLRDREFSYEKNTSTFRILAIGDSFQFGTGVQANETYVKILEANLSKNYSVEVINAGVGGRGTLLEYDYLIHEGYKYDPDMIIITYYVGNDLNDNYQYPREYYLINGYMINQKPTPTVKVKWFLYTHCKSCLFVARSIDNILYGGISKKIDSLDDGSIEIKQFLNELDPQTQQAYNVTFDGFSSLESYASQQNVTLVTVLIPHLLQTQELRGDYLGDAKFNDTKPNDLLKLNLHHLVIDLLAQGFNSSSYYYFKDGHWNKNGHYEASQVVYETIINNQLIPKEYTYGKK